MPTRLEMLIETADMSEPKAARAARLAETLAGLVARNRRRRRDVATTAIQTLHVARLLLQPPPLTQFINASTGDDGDDHLQDDGTDGDDDDDQPQALTLGALPLELLEAVVAGVDGGRGLLTDDEQRRIVAWALDLTGTVGLSRTAFLRACLSSLTWWPDKGGIDLIDDDDDDDDEGDDDANDGDERPRRKRRDEDNDDAEGQAREQQQQQQHDASREATSSNSRWQAILRYFR